MLKHPDSGKRHGANKSRNDISSTKPESLINLNSTYQSIILFRDSDQLKFRSERSSSPSCTHAARGTGRFVQGLIELWHGIPDRRTFIILIAILLLVYLRSPATLIYFREKSLSLRTDSSVS